MTWSTSIPRSASSSQVPIGQPVAQVPAHREQDHLWRKLEPRESRAGLTDGTIRAATLHPASLAPAPTAAPYQATVLNKVNRNVLAELDVHVILDNLSAHKSPTVQHWLLRHRRFHLHFTPTYGSWMNLVERWFSALTTKKLQRSAHRSVKELATDINAWATAWNENPTPFVWHKTADQILERLAGYCTNINQGASA